MRMLYVKHNKQQTFTLRYQLQVLIIRMFDIYFLKIVVHKVNSAFYDERIENL